MSLSTLQVRSHGLGESPESPTRDFVDLEIVVPAFNEAKRLPRTLALALAYLARQSYSSRVLVVDNGSRDETAAVAARHRGGRVPVDVVECLRPGKGSAVRHGFASSRARWVGFMDADLATPIETLDEVIPLLRAGRTAVIGSRRAPGAQFAVAQGPLRRLGGHSFQAAARGLVPGIADTQCGFKFFDGQAARWLAACSEVDGFSFDVEFLARLSRAGHDITEVGVLWSDVEGSSFSPLRDGLRSFSDTLRIRWLLGDWRSRSSEALAELGQRAAVGAAVPAGA